MLSSNCMKVRILQQNIWYGKVINKLIEYLDKNSFDIFTFQEVTGGEYTKRIRGERIDVFQEIKDILGGSYKGYLVKSMTLKGDSDSYIGNATFIRQNLSVEIKEEVFWMNPYQEYAQVFSNEDHDQIINNPYSALVLDLQFANGQKLTVATGHFSWSITPDDRDYKIQRASSLLDYLKEKNLPIILTGDFNSEIETKTVQMFDEIGVNLTKKYGITNTLNGDLHRAKHIFPRGVACDYIFVDSRFKVHDFQLVENGASDHHGLFAEIEID